MEREAAGGGRGRDATGGAAAWRLLLAPWRDLCPEEQEQALVEAERRGRRASRADGRRAMLERDSEPWRAPRPGDYVRAATMGAPAAWAAEWRRRPPGRLVVDARVCAFARAWEQERRGATGGPPLPEDRCSLAHAVRAAREARDRAAAEQREREVAVARAGEIRPGHPARIAMALARVALWRAREDCWLQIMLARAGGLDLLPDRQAEVESPWD
jgi:hypothetical protein